MIRKYIIPVLAFAGLSFAVISVMTTGKPVPAAPPVMQPARAPFDSYIAGAGIVEASTENISIGSSIPGIVSKVHVKVGDKVKKGAPLFSIDDRELRAELAVRRAALLAASERLNRLESLPRAEDIPPAEARVKEAEAGLLELRKQLELAESITDRRAISIEELNRRRFSVQAAEAKLEIALAQLALLKAGPWKPDVEIAKSEVESAKAQVRVVETEIARLTVGAPVDGEILQMNVRPGEFAPAGVVSRPLVLLGDVDRLHIRVDVDENDAWRFGKNASAIAFVRGNREMKVTLVYERTEPYVIPKRSLTGDSTERVDTRVMQVIYSFERSKLQVYAGQQMDVFIEAPPVGQAAPDMARNEMEKK